MISQHVPFCLVLVLENWKHTCAFTESLSCLLSYLYGLNKISDGFMPIYSTLATSCLSFAVFIQDEVIFIQTSVEGASMSM